MSKKAWSLGAIIIVLALAMSGSVSFAQRPPFDPAGQEDAGLQGDGSVTAQTSGQVPLNSIVIGPGTTPAIAESDGQTLVAYESASEGIALAKVVNGILVGTEIIPGLPTGIIDPAIASAQPTTLIVAVTTGVSHSGTTGPLWIVRRVGATWQPAWQPVEGSAFMPSASCWQAHCAVAWAHQVTGENPWVVKFVETNDGGDTWTPVVSLPTPPSGSHDLPVSVLVADDGLVHFAFTRLTRAGGNLWTTEVRHAKALDGKPTAGQTIDTYTGRYTLWTTLRPRLSQEAGGVLHLFYSAQGSAINLSESIDAGTSWRPARTLYSGSHYKVAACQSYLWPPSIDPTVVTYAANGTAVQLMVVGSGLGQTKNFPVEPAFQYSGPSDWIQMKQAMGNYHSCFVDEDYLLTAVFTVNGQVRLTQAHLPGWVVGAGRTVFDRDDNPQGFRFFNEGLSATDFYADITLKSGTSCPQVGFVYYEPGWWADARSFAPATWLSIDTWPPAADRGWCTFQLMISAGTQPGGTVSWTGEIRTYNGWFQNFYLPVIRR